MRAQSSSTERFAYRPEIDGLRAVSVLFIILFHARPDLFPGGYVGVDVFFVISGYLIASMALGDAERGTYAPGAFLMRRLRRIVPALLGMLLVAAMLASLLLVPSQLTHFAGTLAASLAFVSNVSFAAESGYFARAAETMPLLHTWSLSVEAQFYLLFALVFGAVWRRRVLVPLLALAFAFSLASAALGGHAAPVATFFLLHARLWELVAGCLAAVMLARAGPMPAARFGGALALLGLVLVLGALILFDAGTAHPGLLTLLPVLGTLLIVLHAREGTLACRVLSMRGLVFVGVISYSLYLYHYPAITFFRVSTFREPGLVELLLLGAATFVLAWLSWRFVERPFRRRGGMRTGRAIGFSTGMAVVFGAFLLTVSSGIHPGSRQAPQKLAALEAIDAALMPEIHCLQFYYETDPVPCILGDPQGAKTLLAVGDSHMAQWADVLDRLGRERGARVIMYAKSQCPLPPVPVFVPQLRRTLGECDMWREAMLARLPVHEPDMVMLTNSSMGYAGSEGSSTAAAWQAAMESLMSRVVPHADRVFWLVDNPRFESMVFECFERAFWLGDVGGTGCARPRAQALDAALIAREKQAFAAVGQVEVIDFSDHYCGDSHCPGFRFGRPVMRDSNHLSQFATRGLAPDLDRVLFDEAEPEIAQLPLPSEAEIAGPPLQAADLRVSFQVD